MAKKRKRKKNPQLQKKYEEGRWAGIQQATSYFLTRFEELKEVPGIGPKTAEKVKQIMFQSYEREMKK